MKDKKKILDLLSTGIGALGYIKPCNVSVEDNDFVITADNAMREIREIVKDESND